MGYCLGGALSLHAAPSASTCAASSGFHGSLGRTHPAKGEFKPRSVLICHGEADALVPAADQQSFHAEMAELGVKYQFNSTRARSTATNPGHRQGAKGRLAARLRREDGSAVVGGHEGVLDTGDALGARCPITSCRPARRNSVRGRPAGTRWGEGAPDGGDASLRLGAGHPLARHATAKRLLTPRS